MRSDSRAFEDNRITRKALFIASICVLAFIFLCFQFRGPSLSPEISQIAYSLRILERLSRKERHIFEQTELGNVELLPHLWGPRDQPLKKKKGLFAIAAGVKSHERINRLVQQVGLEDFSFIIFHYDNSIEEWLQYAWYKKVASVRAVGQAKYWFAKRFLGASVVENYRYVFLWDDDWDTSRFDAHRYVEILDRFNIHFSQPAQVGSGIHYREVQEKQDTKYGRWTSFVEIGAHVFSVDAWLGCVQDLIPGDIAIAWAFDYSFPRVCARMGYCRTAIIDPYPLEHLNGKTLQTGTRAEFGKRAEAEQVVTKRYFAEGGKCLCPNEWTPNPRNCDCDKPTHVSYRPIVDSDEGRTDCSRDLDGTTPPPYVSSSSSSLL